MTNADKAVLSVEEVLGLPWMSNRGMSDSEWAESNPDGQIVMGVLRPLGADESTLSLAVRSVRNLVVLAAERFETAAETIETYKYDAVGFLKEAEADLMQYRLGIPQTVDLMAIALRQAARV